MFVCSSADGQQQTTKQWARHILGAASAKGGLIVHVGCGDGKLTAALRSSESYIVHGLDRDWQNVAKAREHVRSQKLYGKVSVDQLRGSHLPYIDNLVNLVISRDLGKISMDEVMRVLAPNGVAYIKQGNEWAKTVKPWPKQIDEWTHFLYDATGNAVTKDALVGPPRHMQWTAEPVWTRNHHTLASISGVVSAQGRLFYIVDEGPAASLEVPAKWSLVARDAFNGVFLWKRPISSWAWHRRKFRSGPVQLPRTFVAKGNHVYAALGLDVPVTALDAATGQVVRAYECTEGTEEIILSDGVLLVVTGSPMPEQAAIDAARRGDSKFPNEKTVTAFEAETGTVLWKWSESGDDNLVPLTLAALGWRVFFQTGTTVVCLNRGTGREHWQCSVADSSEPGRAKKTTSKQKRKRKPRATRSAGWSIATLVAYDDVVLWADGKRLVALSAKNGQVLWDCPSKAGFRSPVDVLVAKGLAWLGPDFAVGRDPHTGQVKKNNIAVEDLWTAGHHHRCYREKATDRYILTGKRGIEFLDLTSENHWRNNWVRGACQYGVVPCNGLIHAPSHACGCFMEAKLYGFWALAPARPERMPDSGDLRLEIGPAYGRVAETGSVGASSDDWPMHRRDPLRSGSTMMKFPSQLRDAWSVSIGGELSAPVAAGGTVIASAIDEHQVIALDAEEGKRRWTFTAGGRVDSAPTIYRGLVLFGCADGWVYCLRLSDGEQVWRFRAAPQELNTVALGQVESVWPVHGSVLIEDGVAYTTAGRSSYLDGGIILYGLDPVTGKTICRSNVRSSHPKVAAVTSGLDKPGTEIEKIGQNATDSKTFAAPDKSDAFSMEGATTDILVSDGSSIYMRHLRFTRECVRQEEQSRHLFSTSRLLDGEEVHRSHWVLGTGDFRRIPVAYSWIANSNGSRYGTYLAVPYGLLLAFDDETVWGVRRGKGYTLFAEGNKPFSAEEVSLPDFRKWQGKDTERWKWSVELGIRPRAMLHAGELLFLGGMPYAADQVDLETTYEGSKGGLVWVMSTSNGQKLAEYSVDSPPVWDGMAAANGRLYLSLENGCILSLAEK
ncbi:MAG: PQQ-binding-like beta-propeller repeat protein [Phycisphaerales bacterium]